MAFSLSPGVNSLESELRPIGSKEPHQDILRDAPQLVSISGLSSDLHSKMVSTYDSGWGGALEPMEHTDCLLRGLPQSGGSSVQMQLWSTNDSAALPAAPSSASLSSVASTNTNTNAVAAAAAAAAAVLVDEPCTWTNVHGQATTLPAANNNNNNTTTTNNNSDGSTGSRQTTATATPTQPPLQQPPQQSQAAPQQAQAQAQAPQMPQQPFLFAPQDYAGMQPMTTWFMPSPGGAGGFTQCVAMPALGTPQSASLLPLPPPPPATLPHSSSTHVDCGGAATATATAAAAGYQALWQPSLPPAAGANAQTTMNSAQAMAEMPRWVPCMPGQQFVQLPQGFAMATAAAQGSNSNGAMAGPELSGQTHVLHHDPSSSSSPSSMFLPMQAGMPYVLLMPTTTTTTTTTATAAGPTLPQQQQTQQTPQTQVITPGWAALPPPPPPLSPALPSLQPASIQTPSSHTLPSNASTPQARHSDKLPAQTTQSPASNATSFVAAHTPSHQALSSLPSATPTLGPLLYAAAPPMPPHTHTHTTTNNNNSNALLQQQMNAEKEARATPAYVSPSHVQQQQHMMQPHHHHPQMHFLPPPPPPPLPGVDTMHALPSQASACMSRPIALPTPPWLLPAPASSSSTSSSTTPATSMTPPTATAASTTTTMTGMVQTQTTPSTGHAAQTTAHVKAWMGVNDQWRPLVFGY